MKLGIVIYSNDPETVWNAFRFGNFTLKEGDQVKIFLLGKGVECEALDTENYNISEQIQQLIDNGGEILACGTCLKARKAEGSETCPLSTMKDLYDLVKDSDKVISF